MSRLKATIGTSYKLVSMKGTLLGVLTVPDCIADLLAKRDAVRFHICRPVPVYPSFDRDLGPLLDATTSVGTIARSYDWFWDDAVQLFGISLEDLEQQPGYSFSPGAGYLRSLIE